MYSLDYTNTVTFPDVDETDIGNANDDVRAPNKLSRKDCQNLTKVDLTDDDNQLFYHFQPTGEVRVVWYIKNIHNYWARENQGKRIKSKIFSAPDDSRWRLYLLPNGEAASRDHVAIFLKAIANPHVGERSRMRRY